MLSPSIIKEKNPVDNTDKKEEMNQEKDENDEMRNDENDVVRYDESGNDKDWGIALGIRI